MTVRKCECGIYAIAAIDARFSLFVHSQCEDYFPFVVVAHFVSQCVLIRPSYSPVLTVYCRTRTPPLVALFFNSYSALGSTERANKCSKLLTKRNGCINCPLLPTRGTIWLILSVGLVQMLCCATTLSSTRRAVAGASLPRLAACVCSTTLRLGSVACMCAYLHVHA